MEILIFLWYSLLNGFILIGSLFYANWYWVFAMVGMVFLILEENKEIEEEYDDIERTIV